MIEGEIELQNCVDLPLAPHQAYGASLYLKNKHGFIDTSKPGTGKTLTSITAMTRLAQMNEVDRVLIVCLNIGKYNWVEELKHSRLSWHIVVLDGPVKNRISAIHVSQQPQTILITNYESIFKLERDLSVWKPDLIIADEVHSIKSNTAKKRKYLKKIKAKFRWGLSGTLSPNDPLDVWGPIDWIRPGLFSYKFSEFRDYYATVIYHGGFPLVLKDRYKNLEDLNRKISTCTWGISKEEALSLPEQVFVPIKIDLTSEEARIYKDMAEHMVAETESGMITASTALVKYMRLRMMTGGSEGNFKKAKISALEELMDTLQDEKVVVWAVFDQERLSIVNFLNSIKRPYIYVEANDDAQTRHQKIEAFQNSKTNTVFLCNPKIGGTGVNLQSCSYAIYYSKEWSEGEYEQSLDRLHRRGQANKVTYYSLIARNTIDETIEKALKKKAYLSGQIINRQGLRDLVYGRELQHY